MGDVSESQAEREETQLHYWSLERFQELGFKRHQAEILELAHADWHEAEALLATGCSHETALAILS